MGVKYLHNLEYEIISHIVVIHFPKSYNVLSWGAMLELQRSGIINDTKYIIVNFSKTIEIQDGSMESLILRNEFKASGGIDVIHVGVPSFLREVWLQTASIEEVNSFKKLETVKQALEYLK